MRGTRHKWSLEGARFAQILVDVLNILVATMIVLSSGTKLNVGEAIAHYDSKVIIISMFFVLAVYLLLYGVMGQDVGNLVGGIGFSILAVINYYKVGIRKDSIVPSDFSMKQFKDIYETMLNKEMKQQILYISVFLVLVVIFTVYWFRKYPIKSGKPKRKKLVNRGVLLVLGILLLFGIKLNAREVYKKVGLSAVPFDAIANVERNGVIIHFWGNLSNQLMMKPKGYTKETITRIVNEIEKEQANKKGGAEGKQPNIIFILSEAFWDPTTLKDVSFEKDPMPYLHTIIEQSGGKMLSPEFGGNTANVEFNVMTGYSSNFIIGGKIPYTTISNEQKHVYSIVDNFKNNGYYTMALHPFASHFFGREQVFKNFGFDQAKFEDELKHPKNFVGAYASDEQFVEDIKKADREQTEKNKPYFLHAISMQNHYPYDSAFKYQNAPYVENYESIEGGKGLNLYANGIAKTDQAMKDLLTYLEGSEKETYVVFYGDHLPALSDELFKAHLNVAKGSTYELSKHETAYFIWSNKKNPEITGSISPNYFASKVMEKAGIKTSGFQYFLNKLYEEIPAFSSLGYLNKNGTEQKLTTRQKKLLEEYELLQYDMLDGHKYAKKIFITEKNE